MYLPGPQSNGGLALLVERIDRVRRSLSPEAKRIEQRSRYVLIRLFGMASAKV